MPTDVGFYHTPEVQGGREHILKISWTTNAELLTINSGDLYALSGDRASLMAVAVFEEVSQ